MRGMALVLIAIVGCKRTQPESEATPVSTSEPANPKPAAKPIRLPPLPKTDDPPPAGATIVFTAKRAGTSRVKLIGARGDKALVRDDDRFVSIALSTKTATTMFELAGERCKPTDDDIALAKLERDLRARSRNVVVSADGKRSAWIACDKALVVADGDGKNGKRTQTDVYSGPVFSPDGRRGVRIPSVLGGF